MFSLNHQDDETLITHFDLTPDGQQAWLVDRYGGMSHVDFRESLGTSKRARRWAVQEEGRAGKLGGISVNRELCTPPYADILALMPHIVATAGNDQHLRIWDTRHLLSMSPKASENIISSPPETLVKSETNSEWLNTYLSSSIPVDRVAAQMTSKTGKGLHRAAWQHGKSCSAAYWDPWGRRVLSTSYDDKLRSEYISGWTTLHITDTNNGRLII